MAGHCRRWTNVAIAAALGLLMWLSAVEDATGSSAPQAHIVWHANSTRPYQLQLPRDTNAFFALTERPFQVAKFKIQIEYGPSDAFQHSFEPAAMLFVRPDRPRRGLQKLLANCVGRAQCRNTWLLPITNWRKISRLSSVDGPLVAQYEVVVSLPTASPLRLGGIYDYRDAYIDYETWHDGSWINRYHSANQGDADPALPPVLYSVRTVPDNRPLQGILLARSFIETPPYLSIVTTRHMTFSDTGKPATFQFADKRAPKARSWHSWLGLSREASFAVRANHVNI